MQAGLRCFPSAWAGFAEVQWSPSVWAYEHFWENRRGPAICHSRHQLMFLLQEWEGAFSEVFWSGISFARLVKTRYGGCVGLVRHKQNWGIGWWGDPSWYLKKNQGHKEVEYEALRVCVCFASSWERFCGMSEGDSFCCFVGVPESAENSTT